MCQEARIEGKTYLNVAIFKVAAVHVRFVDPYNSMKRREE